MREYPMRFAPLLRIADKVLRPLFRPIFRLALRYTDPWEHVRVGPPLAYFGAGSERPFSWYLEGPSSVVVQSLDEVCEWLRDCAYPLALDEASAVRSHGWPHPSEFEISRVGTCLDHSLWAWRKLVELGYEANFVVGRVVTAGAPNAWHAWVIFLDDGEDFVLETLARDRDAMVRLVVDVRANYVPMFGANRHGRSFMYGGCLHEMWNEDVRQHSGGPPQN